MADAEPNQLQEAELDEWGLPPQTLTLVVNKWMVIHDALNHYQEFLRERIANPDKTPIEEGGIPIEHDQKDITWIDEITAAIEPLLP